MSAPRDRKAIYIIMPLALAIILVAAAAIIIYGAEGDKAPDDAPIVLVERITGVPVKSYVGEIAFVREKEPSDGGMTAVMVTRFPADYMDFMRIALRMKKGDAALIDSLLGEMPACLESAYPDIYYSYFDYDGIKNAACVCIAADGSYLLLVYDRGGLK